MGDLGKRKARVVLPDGGVEVGFDGNWDEPQFRQLLQTLNTVKQEAQIPCNGKRFFSIQDNVFEMNPRSAGGDDGEDEPCCEHHVAIQAAAEHTATASEGIDNKLDGINDKLTVTDTGHLTLLPLSGGVDVPLPSVPNISVSSLSLHEVRKEDRSFAVLRIPSVTKK